MGKLDPLPNIGAAIDELREFLGDRLLTSDAARQEHGHSESQFPTTPPDAVARVQTTEEVAEVVKICARHGCPVVAQGARTSLEANHLAVHGGINLDMSGMNRVLSVEAEDMLAVVQPGVTREQLNTELRATGLFFPVDPGANASIGGMASTRASGTTAVRYGTMRENVLATEAVLADGRIIRTGTRAKKSSAGYDLTHLLIGAEGTLAILTELTVKLQGQPEAISAATCRFPDVASAVDAVILTIQSGIPMARIEFIDEMMVRGFNSYAKTDLPEVPHLFVEFHGTPAGVAEQAESFGAIAAEYGAEDMQRAETTEDRNALWKMRHSAHYALHELRPGLPSFTTDVCVPISKLAEAVARARKEAERMGLPCAMVGHVGDGNFHCGIPLDMDNPDEIERVQKFSAALAETALELGGTVTGEHGVGVGKAKYMRAEHGEGVDVMRAIKTALDPENILNPGKILPQ